MNQRRYEMIVGMAVILALVVVLLGAYTRLKQSGLGCPDWPGCYGHWIVPASKQNIQRAAIQYPDMPLESGKAWKEMIHRYFAGTLAVFILLISGWTWWQRRTVPRHQLVLTSLLPVLILFQIVLGMWTVTLKLYPLAVMGHLLGGIATLSLLWALFIYPRVKRMYVTSRGIQLRPWIVGGMIVVSIQIILGGWTSANYAAVICPDFPFCQGRMMPVLDFGQAFNIFYPIGANYEGGALSAEARMAIQLCHRVWAVVTFLYLACLSIYILWASLASQYKLCAAVLLSMVMVQTLLGVLNVAWLLSPAVIPVAHNGMASILMLTLITLYVKICPISSKSASAEI